MKYGKYEVSPETMCMEYLRDKDKPKTGMNTASWRYQRPIRPGLSAPCKTACGVGIDVSQILDLLAQGKRKQAWETLYHG